MTDIKSNNDNICRICLESGNEKLNKRCNCINQCHDTCLIKWLKVRTESDYNYLKCEICNSPYKFDKNFNNLLNKNYNKYSVLKLLIPIFYLLLYFNFYSFTYSNCRTSFRKSNFEYFCCVTINIVLFFTLFYTFLFFLFHFISNTNFYIN